jgi:hypothetical protein
MRRGPGCPILLEPRRLLLLTGLDKVFSVFPSVGVAAFSAGLAAIGTRLPADGAGEPLAAATEKMVTAPGSVTVPGQTSGTGNRTSG